MKGDKKIKRRFEKIAGVYDFLVLSGSSRWRQNLLQWATGETLEVGIGTGRNIPYYAENIRLTGIDFSGKMISSATKKHGTNKNLRLLEMDAQKMDFPDNSFDTVVATYVFSSIPDPVKGLKEIKRVCKKDGSVLMLEHVRSKRKLAGFLLDVMNPLTLYTYGANLNRDTENNLLKAGFGKDSVSIKNLWMGIWKEIKIVNVK